MTRKISVIFILSLLLCCACSKSDKPESATQETTIQETTTQETTIQETTTQEETTTEQIVELKWIKEPQYEYEDVQPLIDIYRQEEVDNEVGNFEARAFYTKDNKTGLTDYYGNNIIDSSLEASWNCDYRCGTGILAEGGSYNANGCKGDFVMGGGGIPIKYWNELTNEFIYADTGSIEEDISYTPEKMCAIECVKYDSSKAEGLFDPSAAIEVMDKYRLINEDGELVSIRLFDEIKTNTMYMQYYIVGNYATVKEDGKWGYMQEDGTYLLKPQYEDAYPFVNGIAAVKKDGKAGFIRNDGTEVIEFEYEETRSVYEGKAWVKKDGKWGILDLSNVLDVDIEDCYTTDKMQDAAVDVIEFYANGDTKNFLNPMIISFMDYDMDEKLELFIGDIGARGNIWGYIFKYENGEYYYWSDFSFSGNLEDYNVIYKNNKNEYIFLQTYVGSMADEIYSSTSIYDVKTKTSISLVSSTQNLTEDKITYRKDDTEITKEEYDSTIKKALKGYKKVDSTYDFIHLNDGEYESNVKEAWDAWSIGDSLEEPEETDKQEETEESEESEEAEEQEESESFDFSEYESHGDFCEGLAWVCESDYTGTKYGYINTEGEVIIAFSENITKCYDCKDGVVIVVYKDPNWYYNISVVFYDKDGNEIDRITDAADALPTVKYFNNGNIFIRYAGERYMYINSSGGYLREAEVGLGEECGDYSEGLLYSGDCFGTSAAIGCYVIFFDEYGDVAMELSRETGEYYKGVYSATDFKNGKSQIIFQGLDGKRYTVEIDTKGNWLGEPEKVDDEYRVRE